MCNIADLELSDPHVAGIIAGEQHRQKATIQLLASENYVSPAVLEAIGSVMTNKFSEGYPGNRFGAGCEYIDELESLGVRRAKELFGSEHANLQPHSGSQANMAAYLAVAQIGDTILAMRPDCGGHLTHGARVSLSSRLFDFVHYGVDEKSELIDYEQIRDLARRYRPRIIVAGASAYPRTIDFSIFREIADEVGAILVADVAHYMGLIAGGSFPNPVPYADIVTATTYKVLRGPRGGMILSTGRYAREVDRAVFPLIQSGPHANLTAAKTVALGEAATAQFAGYTSQVVKNARRLASDLADHGFRVISSGTDSHMVLIDVSRLGLTGKEAEARLAACSIVSNKNSIPFDKLSPTVTSGLRFGTAAITTAGATEGHIRTIAVLISEALLLEGAPSVAMADIRRRAVEVARSLHIDQAAEEGQVFACRVATKA